MALNKYLTSRTRRDSNYSSHRDEHIQKSPKIPIISYSPDQNFFQKSLTWLLSVKEDVSFESFVARCLGYVILLIWGISFLDETDFVKDPYGAGDSILHIIHLVFHEAGHFIFRPLGNLMHAFGGSLMQLLMPLIIMVQFIRQKDNFAASIGLWWLGQSFLDLAPYIYDAWDKKLPLLGGGIGQDNPNHHDWHYILQTTNSMDYHAQIALFAGSIGKALLILSLIWGAIILYKTFQALESKNNMLNDL